MKDKLLFALLLIGSFLFYYVPISIILISCGVTSAKILLLVAVLLIAGIIFVFSLAKSASKRDSIIVPNKEEIEVEQKLAS